MCMTVTALNNQLALISREIMCYGRNVSRLYHYHNRKICFPNSLLLQRYLSPSLFTLNTWKSPRTIHSSFSAASSSNNIICQGLPGNLTKQQAKKLASKLSSEERELFLNALNECKSEEDKAGFEGRLAAFRWRSKFGRPTKVPSLGDVDPTGTYCPVPEDWLLRKYAV